MVAGIYRSMKPFHQLYPRLPTVPKLLYDGSHGDGVKNSRSCSSRDRSMSVSSRAKHHDCVEKLQPRRSFYCVAVPLAMRFSREFHADHGLLLLFIGSIDDHEQSTRGNQEEQSSHCSVRNCVHRGSCIGG